MAMRAEGDEIILLITARVTAELLMMDFEISHRPTRLTSPAISPQHSFGQLLVLAFFEPDRRSFQQILVHRMFCVASSANACFCSPGRNPNNREIVCSNRSGCPLSRLAPARKSAQIISRQYPLDLSLPSIRAAVSIACSTTGIWLLYSLK